MREMEIDDARTHVTEMEIDDAGPREPLSRLGFRRAGMRERERVREEIRGRSRAHRIGIVVCTISTTDRRQRRKVCARWTQHNRG